MAMNLEYELTYQATLKEALAVGPGPFGTRLVVEVTGGHFEGKRMRGRILTGGADWLLVGPDGYGRLDVRVQLVTDDGASLYLSYLGVLEMTDKVQAALQTASGTEYGDHYFRTAPRFETGDPRYAWLNRTLFVGEGHILPGRTVEYRVYRVT
ncbi:MAG: DUF3237 domain-containing protein [Candidatus Binatia bacterium]